MVQVNNNANGRALGKGAKEMLSPVEVQNLLQDWFRGEHCNLRDQEDAASRLAFRYQKQVLTELRSAGERKANIHLPETDATRFDFVQEAVEQVIDIIGGNDEGIVAVSSTCASYMLAQLMTANAKEKKDALEPLVMFIQGDFDAIDLSTHSGRSYLLYYYLKARRGESSDEEFESFCTWCLNDEQEEVVEVDA